MNLTLISKDLLPKSKLRWMFFIKHYKNEFSVFFPPTTQSLQQHWTGLDQSFSPCAASPQCSSHINVQAGTPQPTPLTWDVPVGKACKLSLHSHHISWKFSLLLSTSLKRVCGKHLFQFELKHTRRTYTVHITFVLGGRVNELRRFTFLNFLLASPGHLSFSSPLEGKIEHSCSKVMYATLS